MKKVLVLLLAASLCSVAQAQEGEEEDYTVVLPESAQSCVLPAAPDSVPEDAEYDRLLVAKGEVATFQSTLGTYRECLKAAEEGTELTPGNQQALIASYNYSVDMEERVAQRFNDAVRVYKERNPN